MKHCLSYSAHRSNVAVTRTHFEGKGHERTSLISERLSSESQPGDDGHRWRQQTAPLSASQIITIAAFTLDGWLLHTPKSDTTFSHLSGKKKRSLTSRGVHNGVTDKAHDKCFKAAQGMRLSHDNIASYTRAKWPWSRDTSSFKCGSAGNNSTRHLRTCRRKINIVFFRPFAGLPNCLKCL